MSDGATKAGDSVLTRRSRKTMRSDLGPGGTIQVEIDGVGVSWWQRRTAEGVPVFQHGGSWQGQNSGFLFVPEREFAMTLLTNSTTGPTLIAELFFIDWALREFAGVSDPPAVPRTLSPAELRPYEGQYRSWTIAPFGAPDQFVQTMFELKAADGMLRATSEDIELTLGFYREDFVLATEQDGQGHRADFVRGPDGRIAWFRDRGRLYAYQG